MRNQSEPLLSTSASCLSYLYGWSLPCAGLDTFPATTHALCTARIRGDIATRMSLHVAPPHLQSLNRSPAPHPSDPRGGTEGPLISVHNAGSVTREGETARWRRADAVRPFAPGGMPAHTAARRHRAYRIATPTAWLAFSRRIGHSDWISDAEITSVPNAVHQRRFFSEHRRS